MKFELSVKNCAGYMVSKHFFDDFFGGAVSEAGEAILSVSYTHLTLPTKRIV